jgi:hypothetical protein
MSTCMCGNPIDTIGTMCSRCGALQTLGLDMNASAAEIESTYTTLVKVWHPDRFQTDPKMKAAAEEKLKEINAAHDYLTATPRVESSARTQPTAQKIEPAEEFEEAPAPAFIPMESSDEEESEEVRRIMKRMTRRSRPKIVGKVIVITGVVAVIGILVFSLDFFLSTNSSTSRGYDQFKAEIAQDLRAKGILSSNAPDAQGSKDANAQQAPDPNAPTAAAAPAGNPDAKAQSLSGSHSPAKATNGVKPYVTSGLTPTEVLSILGNPTSSSGEKMFYKGSEIDFRNGQVAGWKIDQKTSAIRVKLWPNAAPVPGVTAFAVGSSKSDVIAVQGTPTLFSDSQFGYGKSMVFFQNDKVVGWKEDPGSVRLRVVAH